MPSLALLAALAAAQADPQVARMAEAMPAMLGDSVPGRLIIQGISANGNVLEIRAAQGDIPLGMRPDQAAALFAERICDEPNGRDFFSRGRSVRVELTESPLSGSASRDSCPTAAETEPTAANFAVYLQQHVGQRFDRGLVMRAVRAEGNVLVVTMDGPRGWREGRSPIELTMILAGPFCEPDAGDLDYFSYGRAMRVDTLDDGENPQTGAVVERCPAR